MAAYLLQPEIASAEEIIFNEKNKNSSNIRSSMSTNDIDVLRQMLLKKE